MRVPTSDFLEGIHRSFVHDRRCERIANLFLPFLPDQGRVLDIGCGDGLISGIIGGRKPGLKIIGVERFLRTTFCDAGSGSKACPEGVIPHDHRQEPGSRSGGLPSGSILPLVKIIGFDGTRLPFPDRAFDAILLIDVLHHVEEPEPLLKEIYRVSNGSLIVKDHDLGRPFARRLLSFMDWFGNRRKGFPIDTHYRSWRQIRNLCEKAGFREPAFQRPKGIYPFPFNLLFERGLHFIVRFLR